MKKHNPEQSSKPNQETLRLDFVRSRCARYKLHIPEKLQAIEELADIIETARRSYYENLKQS
ncbi:MAG: hypothetical protein K1X83_08665 [Oligoflexia bacterium]|nr:hypothetical protein [Oligoflexia bacterium]